MKRSEFEDEIASWWELIDFCQNTDGCEYLVEDIIDEDCLDEYLNEWVKNTDYAWNEIRDYLSDIETGYEYYRVDYYDRYEGLTAYDLDDYKEETIRYCDENELWDPEDDDEEVEENSEPSGYESPSAYTPLEVRNGDNFEIQVDQLLQLAFAVAV